MTQALQEHGVWDKLVLNMSWLIFLTIFLWELSGVMVIFQSTNIKDAQEGKQNALWQTNIGFLVFS